MKKLIFLIFLFFSCGLGDFEKEPVEDENSLHPLINSWSIRSIIVTQGTNTSQTDYTDNNGWSLRFYTGDTFFDDKKGSGTYSLNSNRVTLHYDDDREETAIFNFTTNPQSLRLTYIEGENSTTEVYVIQN